jgi:Skp family chaperone for outer membrane proteins
MNFFGILITKSVYNVILWGIVIGLVVLLIFLYLAFLNANRVAKQAKNDKVRVDEELEDLRKTDHDKQVKIKRELQTALNKLDELNK